MWKSYCCVYPLRYSQQYQKKMKNEQKEEMGLRHDCFDALFDHQYLWLALGVEVLWTA